VGRRALLATAATAAACGAGALAAPRLIPALETQLDNAGRDILLNELGTLEGVSLDAALQAAEITRAAVQVLVIPLARFVSAVGAGALDALIAALGAAQNALALVHVQATVLSSFRTVVTSWRDSLTALPITLNAYATADIASAEAYLRALKQMTAHPTQATK
jgi:ABC-type nitrate/sulfonate/bicarbonate transport system substrate-binding protein